MLFRSVLLHGDPDSARRQFALVDDRGAPAAQTGAELHGWDGWAGSRAGRCCVALGNGLAGPAVADEMVAAFEQSTSSLAERLMAALQAGQRGRVVDLEVLADLRRRHPRRPVG